MKTKIILGLDLGTNSIGGSLIELPKENEEYGKTGKILWMGSRIIPTDPNMTQRFGEGKTLGIDEKGNAVSPAANRRQKRMSRRLKHRYKLRRTRLIKIFKMLEWVDETFPEDFKGKLRNDPDFKFNINDYLPFEKSTIDEATKLLGIKNKEGKTNVPEDWIVYYLRKKALKEKISFSELARILYMMNQRRGYEETRGDKGEEETKKEQVVEILTVDSVTLSQEPDPKDKKKLGTYLIEAGNYKWEVKRKEKPDWEGKESKYLITLDFKSSGLLKTIPKPAEEKDWELALVALDNELKNSGKTVGAYFFDKLVNSKEKKNYRIRQQVIQRERYKHELDTIWKKQIQFNKELKQLNEDKDKLREIAAILYPTQTKTNKPKLQEILANDLLYVFSEDIIYYQRPLKSQTQHISECRYEKKQYTNIQTGEEVTEGYKVAPRTSPEAQEFRTWQDIHNLRIIEKEHWQDGKLYADVDVTDAYINEDTKAELFELFDSSKDVDEKTILKKLDLKADNFKINLFANRTTLKGNEIKYLLRRVFKKHEFDGEHLLSDFETLYKLWHILYSIKGTNAAKGIRKGLSNTKHDFRLPEAVIEDLAGLPPLTRQYANLSSKAIRKLLPLTRTEKYWNEKDVHNAVAGFMEWKETKSFEQLGEKIKSQLEPMEDLNDFKGLPVWKAGYIAYGRHSERASNDKYESPDDMDVMQLLPYNTMRNPIVEKVIRETLYLVKDVWDKLNIRPDEIHIELGRELKKTADERKRMSENHAKNFAEKERIKKLLIELKEGNPNSPLHVDRFKIWKANGGRPAQAKFDDLFDKKNEIVVTNAEIKKYRLWADQNHISPYTGESIPLSKLFTRDYEVEHIIPQSKLKNDGYDNLVIAETAVNDFKDNRLARTLINDHGGQTFTRNGITFTLLDQHQYESNCSSNFFGNKRKNLLREDIPDGFITRQLNDTRYITRKVAELLYPVAKDKEGIVLTTGSITSELKGKWGLTEVWKDLMKPRYERLEKILGQPIIKPDEKDANKYHINPLDNGIKIETDTKRIDHRHHALDAVIVAATTRAHINYTNSLHSHDKRQQWKYVAKKGIRKFDLPWPSFTKEAKQYLQSVIVSHKVDKRVVTKPKNKYLKWVEKDGKWKKEYQWQNDPDNKWWAVRKSMFKEPLGLIYLKEVKPVKPIDAVKIQIERNKGVKDEHDKPRDYVYDKHAREQIKLLIEKSGNDIKEIKKVLKQLKDNTGKAYDKIKVAKFDEYAAKRIALDNTFTEKKILGLPYAKRTIEKWIRWEKEGKNNKGKPFPKDTKSWPIPFLLYKHLNEIDADGKKKYKSPGEAFTGEGLDKLYKKAGRPINKVTKYESKKDPTIVNGKILETADGGNVYFVIREHLQTKSRDEMYSVPLWSPDTETDPRKIGAINRLINGKLIADEIEGYRNIVLSPNELVYVPTQEEIDNPKLLEEIDWNGKDRKKVFDRTYKMVSCSAGTCYFIPNNVSSLILSYDSKVGKGEYESLNKSEKTTDKESLTVKNHCIKIDVDRLGNIIEANGKKLSPTGQIQKL